MHWVYPQPQQQHHQQRNAAAWNNQSLSIPSSGASNSLDLHHAIHAQGNNFQTSGFSNNSLTVNNNSLESGSSQILGASGGPPPSIKNGGTGGNENASNSNPSENDDEWKNIHVVSISFRCLHYSKIFYICKSTEFINWSLTESYEIFLLALN